MNYTGNDVYLAFKVKVDKQKVTPVSVRATVYDPENKLVIRRPADIEENQVSIKVPGAKVKKAGAYTAVFLVMLPRYGKKSHVIKFKVSDMPLPDKVQQKEVSNA